MGALEKLGNALVGAWELNGGATGKIRYEWMEGGRFLLQHVDLMAFGRAVKGMEIIAPLQRVNEPPSPEIWSRFYSALDGLTLDYVYELDGRTLTIWFMRKNSDNRFRATFAEDGRSYAGAWAWPGGGYDVVARRI